MTRSKPSPHTQTSLNHSLAGVSAPHLPSSSRGDADRAEALLQLAIALVESALDILERHINTDAQLQHKSALLPGGTLGKHFRHVIETFRAFILPLQPYSPVLPSGPLLISYDAILPSSRRPIARSISVCRRTMASIRSDLVAWGDRCGAGSYGPSGVGSVGEIGTGLPAEMSRSVELVAITPTRQAMSSSVGRELWFCSLHAIHHFSMLRTIAVHELGLNLPVDFGTAPSTLLYREKDPYPTKDANSVRFKSKL